MSDKFTCIPIDKLLNWILEEEKSGYIFGIQKELFFTPRPSDVFSMNRYGQTLETPIGVAAGPHTQLSQNIIASWLTGARYIELKTVQVLDELEVTKPCIHMEDEGYNCEWSQELKLQQSYDEYLNAWIILHVLKDKFGWGDADSSGFIFNMSVGYNLEGILDDAVQKFLDNMADSSKEKAAKIDQLARIYPRIKEITIPDCISDSITISTMHGCPPEEIEKIGQYFVEDRKLNTTIKLNPTLLGPDYLREILNQQLKFDTIVPDAAFEHDLKYDAGVKLINNLTERAKTVGVEFGIKLTNTLEAQNSKGNLPKNEEMLYMSGRALHAISVNVAKKLQNTFDGDLDISFSAGVDCFNVASVLSCNMKPVTVCSDLLKPGGYGRLSQYLQEIKKALAAENADSIAEYIKKVSGIDGTLQEAALKNLTDYSTRIIKDPKYSKKSFPFDNIKTEKELPIFDCASAPCISECPTCQDIPSYLYYTAKGEFEKAHQVIMDTNPFPNIQGKVCHQPCQNKCTRINYDNPLKIREIKRFIAEKNRETWQDPNPTKNGLKVGIIGAGPSGLSCANFLIQRGFGVDIYEGKSFAGGMAADAIPSFRLDAQSMNLDIEKIIKQGVEIHYNSKIDRKSFDTIQQSHDFVYIAIGAQIPMKMGIPGEDSNRVFDQLSFLSDVHSEKIPEIGKNVAIIGGGNSAMDAARVAKRIVGETGAVTVLYRRTQKEMPAEWEEIEAAIKEGILIDELVAPEKIESENDAVTAIICSKMRLGEPDNSGRPRPVKIEGATTRLELDSVIYAIGQKVNLDFLTADQSKIDPETRETRIKNVFTGGDAVRGASTLIDAIADGRKTAELIIQKALNQKSERVITADRELNFPEIHQKISRRQYSWNMQEDETNPSLDFKLPPLKMDDDQAISEASRCLACDLSCSICTTVCPNRANIFFAVKTGEYPHQKIIPKSETTVIETIDTFQVKQEHQIINIHDFCNECGNCTSFCPTSGAPYKDKLKFYLSKDDFDKSDTGYYLISQSLYFKADGKIATLTLKKDHLHYQTDEIEVTLDSQNYTITEVESIADRVNEIDLKPAVEMAILLVSLKDLYIFS